MIIVKKVEFIVFISLSLVTVSCISPVSSSWSCKNNVVGSCKTIGEIDNNLVANKDNRGEINLNNKLKQENYDSGINGSNISFNSFRSKENVARVMFSPYIDEAGNRHDKSIVYYLEQKAEWKK